jgi:hypothetical protein
MNMWWPYVIGYLFAIVIAHFPISWVVNRMWESIGWAKDNKERIRPASWQPSILGCVERALYVAFFQLGKPEFISVWLAMKIAGHWKGWSEDREYEGGVITGRMVYNIFLIGSALSIGYAVTGAKLVEWCLRQEWSLAIGVPVSLLLATSVLGYWVGRYRHVG